MKRILCILLALLILSTVSCTDNNSASSETAGNQADASISEDTTTENQNTPEETVPVYDSGDADFDGYAFRIMNYESYVSTYLLLAPDEQTGEALNDIIYERNSKAEETLNFVLQEIREPYTGWGSSQIALCDNVIQSVTANDNAYDAAYLPVSFKSSIITDGYLMDLNTIPGLHVYESYWDAPLNHDMTINGKLFAASGPLNLCSLGLSDVLLFNENMFKTLNLSLPYDHVRNNTWTLDTLAEYVQETTNLNGASDFEYDQSAQTVYGIAGHSDKPYALLYGAGCYLVRKDNDTVTLGIEEEHLYNAAESIAQIMKKSMGQVIFNNSDSAPGGYTNLFASDRAAFITCELKTVNVLRDMDSSFGLLPMPKYDQSQEDYHSSVSANSLFLTIPKSQTDPARAALILDYLHYYSYHNSLPVYYNVTVSHKGLRNEDSIEMLDIVYNSRGIEFSQIFGATIGWVTAFNNQIVNENLTLASTSASNKNSILRSMEAIFASLGE